MLDHLYSPQMSDIFVRLLNFNKSVFTPKDPDSSSSREYDSDQKGAESEAKAIVSDNEA